MAPLSQKGGVGGNSHVGLGCPLPLPRPPFANRECIALVDLGGENRPVFPFYEGELALRKVCQLWPKKTRIGHKMAGELTILIP